MDEYNNSIEELLKDFEELQIREIVKQVNTNQQEVLEVTLLIRTIMKKENHHTNPEVLIHLFRNILKGFLIEKDGQL